MDVVFHILIPFALLLIMGIRFARRLTPYFILLSLLPDLDRFLMQRHSLFHNLFFPFVVAALVYVLWGDRRLAVFSLYFLLSHLLLDTGNFVSYFYPFKSTFYSVSLTLEMENFIPAVHFSIMTSDAVRQKVGNIISPQGFAVLVLAGLLAARRRMRS
ncbi:MAG: hypothetical protein V1921_04065 [Candidatus Altiarchaeota archaeon]